MEFLPWAEPRNACLCFDGTLYRSKSHRCTSSGIAVLVDTALGDAGVEQSSSRSAGIGSVGGLAAEHGVAVTRHERRERSHRHRAPTYPVVVGVMINDDQHMV
jgi:hypothetical protein